MEHRPIIIAIPFMRESAARGRSFSPGRVSAAQGKISNASQKVAHACEKVLDPWGKVSHAWGKVLDASETFSGDDDLGAKVAFVACFPRL